MKWAPVVGSMKNGLTSSEADDTSIDFFAAQSTFDKITTHACNRFPCSGSASSRSSAMRSCNFISNSICFPASILANRFASTSWTNLLCKSIWLRSVYLLNGFSELTFPVSRSYSEIFKDDIIRRSDYPNLYYGNAPVPNATVECAGNRLASNHCWRPHASHSRWQRTHRNCCQSTDCTVMWPSRNYCHGVASAMCRAKPNDSAVKYRNGQEFVNQLFDANYRCEIREGFAFAGRRLANTKSKSTEPPVERCQIN